MSTRPRGHPSSHLPLPHSLATTSDGESRNGWKQQIYAQKTDKMQKTRAESTRVGQQLPQTGTDARRVSKRFSGLRAARFSQNQRTEFTYLFRDYRIRSNFWKFYLIRTGFTLGELVFLVKVFRLFRLEGIIFLCSDCGHSM